MRPVVLIIRDGWGVNERKEGNSVYGAKTPVIDQIRARYPHCLLDCCGEAVGLPDGYQGSSEVGHLNMGAGRIVVQELKRIDDGLSATSSRARSGRTSSQTGRRTTRSSISSASFRTRASTPTRSTSSSS